MKQLLLFAMLLMASFTKVSSTPNALHQTNDFIIITDAIVYVNADKYMNAQSVRIKLLNSSGNVLASATTVPGGTVAFSRNDACKTVRNVYQMADGQEYIIDYDYDIPF